jgi:hypothetical protein
MRMAFLDRLAEIAQQFGHPIPNDAGPQQVVDAASDHVSQISEGELREHLQSSVAQMDAHGRVSLAQTILGLLAEHGTSPEAAANAAGVPPNAVAGGAPDAVQALIDIAGQHPGLLPSAAAAFVQRNPELLTQFAPGLLSGVLARLAHR